MSVMIRGMKMPEDCPVCPLAHWNKLDNFTGCEVTKRYFAKEDMETAGRPSFCPLIELPTQHGRLIDADALKDVLEILIDKGGDIRYWELMRWILNDTPTIIEAEVSE